MLWDPLACMERGGVGEGVWAPFAREGGSWILLSAPSLSCHLRNSEGGRPPPQPPLVSGRLPIQAWGHPFNPGGSYLLLRVFFWFPQTTATPPHHGGIHGAKKGCARGPWWWWKSRHELHWHRSPGDAATTMLVRHSLTLVFPNHSLTPN